jgi:hypothetical protein
MAIGQDKRIAAALNTTHAPPLPGNWGTLYELTRLSDDQFRKGLESGIIRPDMERSEVAALLAKSEIDVVEASALAVIARVIDIIESLFDGGTDIFEAERESAPLWPAVEETFDAYLRN